MYRRQLLLSMMMLAPALTARASDQALLIELEQDSDALPSSVSASGAVVVGGLSSGGGFYWMPTTGTVFIGGLGASSVSGDGSTIVGSALDSRGIQAAIWQRAAEWRLLGSFTPGALSCGASLSSASATSRDGHVVVGLGWDGCKFAHAFRWEDSTGMVDLGSTVAGKSSRADGVSGDGNVVVGQQEAATGFTQGAQWVGGQQSLFTGPGGEVGTAKAANLDGSIVVGRVCDPSAARPSDPTFQSAWVWTKQDGLKCLAAPALRASPGPLIIVEASATSDDGRVIGGSQNVGGSEDSDAVIWIDRVPYYLKDYLAAHGVPDAFRTWVNTGSITDISPDGRILVGKGAALGGFQGYIVILGDNP
jgi:probable HAF family extracellular repeat protein